MRLWSTGRGFWDFGLRFKEDDGVGWSYIRACISWFLLVFLPGGFCLGSVVKILGMQH